MANKATNKKQKSLEETLWDSANKLRGSVEPSEYKHVVLSLIFLKFASEKFEHRRQELTDEGKEKYLDMVEFYTMKNVFYLPEESRWGYIKKHAKQDDIAIKIDTALHTAEKTNKALEGALPDNYFSRLNLDVSKLAALIDTDKSKEIDIFNDDYLAKIEKIKLPNTKIKLLQYLLSKAIDEFKKINKIKGIDFTKKFNALVEQYNDRKEQDVLVSNVLEDFTGEIIDLFHAMKKEKESFGDMGIDLEEKAFYDILKALTIKYDFEYPEDKLLKLAKGVKKVVDDKAKYTDWSHRDDIKAELKADLIILLAENGYPPVDRDEVYKEIFEQAENFKKYQGK